MIVGHRDPFSDGNRIPKCKGEEQCNYNYKIIAKN